MLPWVWLLKFQRVSLMLHKIDGISKWGCLTFVTVSVSFCFPPQLFHSPCPTCKLVFYDSTLTPLIGARLATLRRLVLIDQFESAQFDSVAAIHICQWPSLKERTPAAVLSLLLNLKPICIHIRRFCSTRHYSAQPPSLLWYFIIQCSPITSSSPRNLLLVSSQEATDLR